MSAENFYGSAFTGPEIDSAIAWVKQQQSGGGGIFSNIPAGLIAIWSGTIENVPDGWHLCDGENGTPDLRDKFLLGAGTTHGVGETGGEEMHKLTVSEMPTHRHPIYTETTSVNSAGGRTHLGVGYTINNTWTDNAGLVSEYVGSSNPHNNMPPYYALAYIMKL